MPGKAKDARSIAAAARRQKVLELRKHGVSLRAIAQQLGVSHQQVHNDLRAALSTVKDVEQGKAEELRALEVERLDGLLLAIAPRVRQGDLGAIDRALRIYESRRRLLGLDAPTKVAPTDPSGDNPYAAVSDEQLRLDLLKLVAALTGADGAAAGGGALPLEPERASEPAAAAG